MDDAVDYEEESVARKFSPAVLFETAADVFEEAVAHISVFNLEAEQNIPCFDNSEILCGNLIGKGGFCEVREIKSFDLDYEGYASNMPPRRRSKNSSQTKSEEASTVSIPETREELAWSCVGKGKSRYCVKTLSPFEGGEKRKRSAEIVKAIVDLAFEAKFLAALDHPHVIKLAATSQVSPFESGYFIMLELLPETLEKRRKKWVVTDGQCKGVTGALTGGKKKKFAFYQERLQVAHDIAGALGYMHHMKIIYRDLKPSNIGFDSRRVVKIFDLGLAKQLREDEREEDGSYRMTAMTGSVRYMAPEIGRREPYNLSVDVYSFSMCLWYIMALEPPFTLWSSHTIVKKVFRGGKRPVTLAAWSDGLKSIMRKCWKEKATSRPKFDRVQDMIEDEMNVFASDAKAK